MKNVVINGRPFSPATENFPIIIHGKEGSGASFFSIILVASIYRYGQSILFWSAYPMAKEEFRKELNGQSEIHSIINADDISSDEPQIMVMDNGNPEELLAALQKINPKRITFVKNFETLPQETRNILIDREACIISGDLEKVLTEEQISKFSTKIFFSPFPKIELPLLQQYEGSIRYAGQNGIICVEEV